MVVFLYAVMGLLQLATAIIGSHVSAMTGSPDGLFAAGVFALLGIVSIGFACAAWEPKDNRRYMM